MDYQEFLKRKVLQAKTKKALDIKSLNENLFDYQKDVVQFLAGRGNGAAFLDTGMGKSLVALDWGRIVVENTNKPVLMIAPLAVGPQHVGEAEKFDVIDAEFTRNPLDKYEKKIYLTNYENVHKFDAGDFGGVILDESSIIKNYTGKTTRAFMDQFGELDHKLCCTATPAPNDYMELGQHCQFLDVMSSSEMLARWFIADQSAMGTYKLKNAAIDDYWSWVASWARCLTKPSDLGYSDENYKLPDLIIKKHIAETDISGFDQGMLLRAPDMSSTAIHAEKRKTAADRARMAAELSEQCEGAHVIWCDTNYEADELVKIMPDAKEVRGDMKPDLKEDLLVGFSKGDYKTLITKPKVAGFGLNWQHCHETIYAGITYSYEAFYQSARRFYRFGQTKDVKAHIIMTQTEEGIWQTVQRKKMQHEKMKHEMTRAMSRAVIEKGVRNAYEPTLPAKLPSFLNS